MKEITIKLYDVTELSKESQSKVIEEHKSFLIDIYRDEDYDPCFNMTRSKYAKSLTKAEIIEDIQNNEYLFFADGTQAEVVTYCGKHPKAGVTEFKLFGEIYEVNG